MFLKPGDPLDQYSIDRDFSSLWNTGYFDDLRFEREDTSKGDLTPAREAHLAGE